MGVADPRPPMPGPYLNNPNSCIITQETMHMEEPHPL